jgi:hypothetical protein
MEDCMQVRMPPASTYSMSTNVRDQYEDFKFIYVGLLERIVEHIVNRIGVGLM